MHKRNSSKHSEITAIGSLRCRKKRWNSEAQEVTDASQDRQKVRLRLFIGLFLKRMQQLMISKRYETEQLAEVVKRKVCSHIRLHMYRCAS